MQTEYLILGGVAAYLLFANKSSAKPAPAPVTTPTPIPNATPTPGNILDQIVAGNYGAAVPGIISQLPTFGATGAPTAVGNSFDPADPGSNRAFAPMSYRPGVSPVNVAGTSVGIPGSVPAPSPARRIKAPAGAVPYSPFGGGAGRMLAIMSN